MTGPAVPEATNGEAWAALLSGSRAHCHELTRRAARNFYWGMKLVPEPKRSAMFALYAWMREADDLADGGGDAAAKERRLDAFARHTEAALAPRTDPGLMNQSPLWPAVRDMAARYRVPHRYFHDMIAGQIIDQRKTRYRTFDELYDYCYKVASVVGLSCIEIWGYEGGQHTRQLSEWRGIALQLTNILRDVLEDAQRDRVYLPAEDFDVFELNPAMFTLGGGPTPEALRGVGRVIERARRFYQKSAHLEKHVHPDGRPCLWAMTAIYRALLDKIERDPAAVLRGQRVRLAPLRKGWIALNASLRKGWGR